MENTKQEQLEQIKQSLVSSLYEAVELINDDDRPEFIKECIKTAEDIEEMLEKHYNIIVMGHNEGNKITHMKLLEMCADRTGFEREIAEWHFKSKE